MCFMFGASKEQVHRMLGLVDEAEHDDEVIEAEELEANPESTSYAQAVSHGLGASPHAWHSIRVCVEPPP